MSRVRTTMFWLHVLGCFAASDSFVLDGLVNETGLHLGMENMIAAARERLQLIGYHLFDAISRMPAVLEKAQWTTRWMNHRICIILRDQNAAVTQLALMVPSTCDGASVEILKNVTSRTASLTSAIDGKCPAASSASGFTSSCAASATSSHVCETTEVCSAPSGAPALAAASLADS